MKKKNNILRNLPSTFQAGWVEFTFSTKKNLTDDEGAKCYGITDLNQFTVTLEEDMGEKQAHHTIIHECCHILMDTLGFGGPDEGSADTIVSNNEDITEATCRAFLLFKNLNPELWNTLFKEYYE